MGKRFTSMEKWDKEWFQKLPPRLKCLWQYMTDKCDMAGVWEANYRLAGFIIGEEVSEEDLAAFGDRVKVLSGDKVLLTQFVSFQYGTLSEKSRVHMAVVKNASKHGISLGFTPNPSDSLSKGSNEPSDRVKDKDKDKDKKKGKDCKDSYPEASEVLLYLNSTAGREFRSTPINLKAINARLSESGVTVDGVKSMIQRQTVLWGSDPKMSEFLTIKTLFAKSNFDNYYDQRNQPTGKALAAKSTQGETQYGPNGLPMEVIRP